MKNIAIISTFALGLLSGGQALAQKEIKLWGDNVPGAKSSDSYHEKVEIINNGRSPRISRVTDPTLTVYLPNNDNKGRTAIVVCPGGGYGRLAIDHEGYDVAQYLRSQGVAAFVLKYRLPSDQIMDDKTVGSLADVQRAIRLVRQHADEWGIDPNKVGVVGFSAGGHLAATASTMFDRVVYPLAENEPSARPDFSLLIYPVISLDAAITHRGTRENLLGKDASDDKAAAFSNENLVSDNTPPAFLVHAFDDGAVPYENSIRYAKAMTAHSRPVELHLFQNGGHGFGMSLNTPRSWMPQCFLWLDANGFLQI